MTQMLDGTGVPVAVAVLLGAEVAVPVAVLPLTVAPVRMPDRGRYGKSYSDVKVHVLPRIARAANDHGQGWLPQAKSDRVDHEPDPPVKPGFRG